MILSICPKLPMRNKKVTRDFFENHLDFIVLGEYDEYLIAKRDEIEIHFFEHKELDPKLNYGQVYLRVNHIEELFEALQGRGVKIHPNGHLQIKPWGQKEFSLLDPDNNLLTFGESLDE